MKKVLTFGTFDGLHPGHIFYLTQAQNLGDKLYVCIARDNTVEKVKEKKTKFSQEERKAAIKEYFPDADVVIGHSSDRTKIIRDIRPDIICLGHDQRHFVDQIKPCLKENNIDCEIIRMKDFYPDVYKTSIIRKKDFDQRNTHGNQ